MRSAIGLSREFGAETETEPRALPGRPPRTAKAGFDDLVLVCAKCAKRQGFRKGEAAKRLKRALRARAGGKAGIVKTRIVKTRIVESRCLGPCPKRLLTLATPDSLSRGRLLLIDPALPDAELDALVPAPRAGGR